LDNGEFMADRGSRPFRARSFSWSHAARPPKSHTRSPTGSHARSPRVQAMSTRVSARVSRQTSPERVSSPL
jgi:hypothetical protein